jgi:soluble lytic murein transglycosylase-like protein
MTGALLPLFLAAVAATPAAPPRPPAPPDPRVALVDLQLAGDLVGALAATEALLAREPGRGAELGLDYLRGDLLARLGRPAEAKAAFARVLEASPALATYGRYRLALLQAASGHPEVAAGLVANLLLHQPPAALLEPAVELLRASLAGGGDCRLLRGLVAPASGRPLALPTPAARGLTLTRAECALRDGRGDEARDLLARLLADSTEDDRGRAAAELLAGSTVPRVDRTLSGLMGRAFHDHREFDRATPLLVEALRDTAASAATRDELAYALARSLFWLGSWPAAARQFGELAERTVGPENRSRAFYQQGRALELAGERGAAARAFARATLAGTASTWTPGALLAALRLAALAGDHDDALAELARLEAVGAWREQAAHGAMFLAVSAVVARRSEGVGGLLAVATRGGRPTAEVAYWQGRLAELAGDIRPAVRAYLRALTADRFHPHAQAARDRLVSPELASYARALAIELSRSAEPSDLYAAWLVLGDGEPRGVAARRTLTRAFAADRRTATWVELAPVATSDWPLWRVPLARPEERLLALGLWEEGLAVMRQHFPVSRPALAMTGSAILARAGATQRALYIAEVLAHRVPPQLPPELLAPELRRLLYPRAWADVVAREAASAGVDPNLVIAVLREESRFDAGATSGANARGLMQLVLPTAQRLAGSLGIARLEPIDLYRPEVSIRLGAAYLAELEARFGGRSAVAQSVAAYNAGEPQAELWRRYCATDEQVEYLSKVSFKETRDYLARVLASRAQYADLYRAD